MAAAPSTWNAGTAQGAPGESALDMGRPDIAQERRAAIKKLDGLAGVASRAADSAHAKTSSLGWTAFASGFGMFALGLPGAIESATAAASLEVGFGVTLAVCVGAALAFKSSANRSQAQASSLSASASSLRMGALMDAVALELTHGTQTEVPGGADVAAKLISARAAAKEREAKDAEQASMKASPAAPTASSKP